jgi:hypothetical protein
MGWRFWAVAILGGSVAAAAAPVPGADAEAISATAAKMLRNNQVAGELELSDEQRSALGESPASTGVSSRLTASQLARLRQLERQVLGPAAFADPRILKTLALDTDQQAVVTEILTELEQRVADYLAIFGNDDADNLKAELLACRQRGLARIDRTLSAGQRALWKDLASKPPTSFDPSLYWLYVIVEERLQAR